MSKTVVIALERFERDARKIAEYLEADYLEYAAGAFEKAFDSYRAIVACMSAGIAVRCIAPLLQDKWTDPAVVVVSPDLRYAIPIAGGHHGGNDLARQLSSLGIVPVITTATETMGKPSVEGIAATRQLEVLNRDSTRQVNAAMLDSDVPVYTVAGPGIVVAGPGVSILVRKGEYVVGIGCNTKTASTEITAVVKAALGEAGIDENEVMAYATTVKKRHEPGLLEAIRSLHSNLVFVEDEIVNVQLAASPSRATILGLRGVAEPCALAISKHKELVREKRAYGNVTIAIAR